MHTQFKSPISEPACAAHLIEGFSLRLVAIVIATLLWLLFSKRAKA